MKRIGALGFALALAACEPAGTPAPEAAQTAPAAPSETPAPPAQPSGPARTVEAESEPSDAAWVTDVHHVKDADVKIFSTAGGDPAINGLYTYLAVYTPPEGWTRVFMVGDFNAWEVAEESPTRVVLKVSRSWIEEETGDVKTAEEKLILDVPASEDAPLTVTPAA